MWAHPLNQIPNILTSTNTSQVEEQTEFKAVHEIAFYHRNETFPVFQHTQQDSTQPKARED